MSVARTIGIIAAACWLIITSNAVAQQTSTSTSDDDQPMALIENSMDNLLPIEGQRFRIDNNVEEITLLFFRERNSSPLILIRPDGSKWYDSDYPVERVTWYTDPNFDMIKIDKPEPGPWQVAGRVDKNNKAVIVSDIRFVAETLPELLYEHEVIKVEGTLFNGDSPVSTSRFRETVLLDVLFVSSNNPDFDNFGAQPTRVAEFSDNGKGYDEEVGDGVFTGQFALHVVPGEYIPTYQLQTPLYERSFEDDKVVVERSPVEFTVETSEQRGDDNRLIVDIEPQLVRPNSIIVNGTVNYPNGEERRFSVTDMPGFPHTIALDNLAYGKHHINLSVFATTANGREIELKPPKMSFISVEPIPEPTAEELAEQARQEAVRNAEQERLQREKEQQQLVFNVIIVAVVNLMLIGLAVGLFGWRRRKAAQK